MGVTRMNDSPENDLNLVAGMFFGQTGSGRIVYRLTESEENRRFTTPNNVDEMDANNRTDAEETHDAD